ncbi:unnamed protein product [Enterobius vermicularis]|uniref:DM domain-containing protein n=1 Tax=Enterobius vermicularis TaxID=51028 RepID=A0A0N4VN61_ENTVE|nr:unnamed protein product [Enterobius vermicularis]
MMRLETLNTIAALNAAAVTAANAEKIGNKRVYYCQRCLNHNRLEPRKNHKCDCLYATCTCNKCILVEKRRVLNTQLHELEDVFDGDNDGENDEQLSVTSRNKGGMLKFKKDRYFMCLPTITHQFICGGDISVRQKEKNCSCKMEMRTVFSFFWDKQRKKKER